MARITVEDCSKVEQNRFALVVYAANRAKSLYQGATPSVSRDNDKPSVIALREIAEQTINIDKIKNNVIQNLQKVYLQEEASQDVVDSAADDNSFSIDISEEISSYTISDNFDEDASFFDDIEE